jgi:hypothetical protein
MTMAWKIGEEHKYGIDIADADGDRTVLTVYGHDGLEFMWARARLVENAPDMFRALVDLTEHAERHFPNTLLPMVKEAKKLVRRIGEPTGGGEKREEETATQESLYDIARRLKDRSEQDRNSSLKDKTTG